MKPINKVIMATVAGLIAIAGVVALSTYSPVSVHATAKEKIVVHLSQYSHDSHAALMAVHFAQYLQEHGSDVTLMLDVEGVKLADKRQVQTSGTGMNAQITTHYDAFVKAGGKVLVCPHCAEVAGLTAQSLRPGAHMAKNIGELEDTILAANKILDY